MRKIIYETFLILLIISNDAFASAWTRKKGEFFSIVELLDESSEFKALFKNVSENYYRTTSYKLYLEYGLIDKLTIGGYIKDYNFYTKYYGRNLTLIRKVKNDFYSNIFLIHNLYNKNKNVFSLQYSFYFPIKYNDISEDVNTLDTKYAFEFSLLYGREGEINIEELFNVYAKYFLDMSLSYKLVDDIDYDQITFATTAGIRFNDSSSFNFRYEYKYFLEDNLLKKKRNFYSYYEGSNSNQIKVSVDYKFLDNLSTELAYYRTFSDVDSSGFTFSFIFNK